MRKMKEAMQAEEEGEDEEEERDKDEEMKVDEDKVNGALGFNPSPEDVGKDEVELANEGRGGF